MELKKLLLKHVRFIAGLLFVGVLALAYVNYTTVKQLRNTENELSLTSSELNEKILALQSSLEAKEGENKKLSTLLQNVEQEKSEVTSQLGEISATLNVYEKLKSLDSELIQKYSKVFFLNEHYIPEELVDIDKAYLYSTTEPEQIHGKVAPYLRGLLVDAEQDGVVLQVLSAYRSFGEQANLKAGYKVSYGAGANQFSADQGYSEHQLGTTVDFTTPSVGAKLTGFETTPAYEWLVNKAHKYGFVLSYPKGNKYYIFEPWHWRFVGTDLAQRLNRDGKFFYDMDQRDIDEYLITIFD